MSSSSPERSYKSLAKAFYKHSEAGGRKGNLEGCVSRLVREGGNLRLNQTSHRTRFVKWLEKTLKVPRNLRQQPHLNFRWNDDPMRVRRSLNYRFETFHKDATPGSANVSLRNLHLSQNASRNITPEDEVDGFIERLDYQVRHPNLHNKINKIDTDFSVEQLLEGDINPNFFLSGIRRQLVTKLGVDIEDLAALEFHDNQLFIPTNIVKRFSSPISHRES